MRLEKEFTQVNDYVVETRRKLHQLAEISDEEIKTFAFIKNEIESMGFNYEIVSTTSLVARLETGKPGKVVAMRADIDALAVKENKMNLKTERTCVSNNPDICHACGHDAHAAMLLASMKVLMTIKNELVGTYYFCFEQGEELGRKKGSVPIINYLSDKNVDTVWAIHVYNKLESGKICVDDGPRMAGIAGAIVKIVGKGGHGSRPDLSKNPVFVAANIVVNLAGVFENKIDANETVTLGITTIEGGGTMNVFSDEAKILGTFRFFNEVEGNRAVELFKSVCEHTATMYGCTVEFDERTRVLGRPIKTDLECSQFAKQVLPDFIDQSSIASCVPWLASESFSTYARTYPSIFAFLGIKNDEKGCGAEHHSEFFDIDEDALIVGVKATVGYAISYASKK